LRYSHVGTGGLGVKKILSSFQELSKIHLRPAYLIMAKRRKLLAALDAHQGRDSDLEKQKRLQRQAAKRKHSKAELATDLHEKENLRVPNDDAAPLPEVESEGWGNDKSEAVEAYTVRRLVYDIQII